jgi:hypothetical protein
MGVNHRRSHILVAQKLLNCSDVIAILYQVRCKRVPRCVTRRSLGQPCFRDRLLECLLQDGFINVMATLFACPVIYPATLLWKDPLPAPLTRSVGILPSSASGNGTRPQPSARSFWCTAFTLRRCSSRGSFSDFGSIVTRSFPPLPSRTSISLRAQRLARAAAGTPSNAIPRHT